MAKGLGRELLAEFLGTFVLIVFGVGVVAQTVLSKGTAGTTLSINLVGACGRDGLLRVRRRDRRAAGGDAGPRRSPSLLAQRWRHHGADRRRVCPSAVVCHVSRSARRVRRQHAP